MTDNTLKLQQLCGVTIEHLTGYLAPGEKPSRESAEVAVEVLRVLSRNGSAVLEDTEGSGSLLNGLRCGDIGTD